MTTDTEVAPYGSWRSPVTAESLTAQAVTLSEPRLDGPDAYWLEGRPSDGGRCVVVRRSADGRTHDVTAAPFNVRSRVHEYGGGAYDVAGGVLVFCNFDDRRVYRLDVSDTGTDPRPITPAGGLRYGDLRITPDRRSVVAVCEDHSREGTEPTNTLVRLALGDPNLDRETVLVEGHDFVSSGTVSRDGRRLAWVQWDHPNMPWDAAEVCVADLDDTGRPGGARVVAGGPGESALSPAWTPDGHLVFLSDRTGWWNLYALNESLESPAPEALWPADHEFFGPQWMLGSSSYALTDDGTVVCCWYSEGYARLGTIDLATGARRSLRSEATAVSAVRTSGAATLLILEYADRPAAVVSLELDGSDRVTVLREAGPRLLAADLVSRAEAVSWQSPDGEQVHGFLSPPRNPRFVGPDDERPPLIVLSHGGPTGMSRPIFDLGTQYWTSRGFGVLAVNYRGSSGYGRAYRDRLRGQWGIVDVDDCTSGAVAMATAGRADPRRLVIKGGSAGGFTTLAALAFRDTFAAGTSYFGVSDLESLALDTHKFESRYLDGLVGPYPARADLYRARSPIHSVDTITCPLLLLQGADDEVVPPNQAESMAAAVRAKGLPVALIVFEGEGHGFRLAENVIRATEAEAYFYSRVFGFDLADDVPPVEIDNLV